MKNSKTIVAVRGSSTIAKKKTVNKPAKDRKVHIRSKEVYDATMHAIGLLMAKGETNLSAAELKRLKGLAEAAENYEDTHDPLPVPASLSDMVKMKLFQLRINQQFAAKLLGVSDTKFSMIMNGKQKPDIYFIKAVHDKLHVDADQLLKAI